MTEQEAYQRLEKAIIELKDQNLLAKSYQIQLALAIVQSSQSSLPKL